MNFDTVKQDGVLVVPFEIEHLDADNSKEFRKAMHEVVTSASRVVFDLGSLKFVDSSGLGAILSCLRELSDAGGDLKLCNMSRTVRTMFELVRMHRIFEIFADQEEALASF